MKRIVVVGNIAGGKSVLSRRLAQIHALPLTHIDSIQFLPGMKVRPLVETRSVLRAIVAKDRWLIDGYGPLDLLEERFARADHIVFVDLPLWRHLWWLTKRQLRVAVWGPRPELAPEVNEATWEHTKRLYKTLLGMHEKMRPELLKIFTKPECREKMVWVRSYGEWRGLHADGIPK